MHYASFANFNITCTCGGYFAPGKGTLWMRAPFAFSQSKFYCITKGTCSLTIDGKSYEAQKGDWFFIPAGTQHSYSNFPDKPFEKYWMHFDFFPEADILTSLPDMPYVVKLPPESDVLRLFASYFELYESDRLADNMKKKAILFTLLAEYIHLAYPEETPHLEVSGDAQIDAVVRYIHQHIREPLSIAALAEAFFMHPNYFIRFFKNKTGLTPARYIKMEKMRLARSMLIKTDLPVAKIMEKIGQTDSCSFSKQFKSIYAFSPQEFRRYYRMNLFE